MHFQWLLSISHASYVKAISWLQNSCDRAKYLQKAENLLSSTVAAVTTAVPSNAVDCFSPQLDFISLPSPNIFFSFLYSFSFIPSRHLPDIRPVFSRLWDWNSLHRGPHSDMESMCTSRSLLCTIVRRHTCSGLLEAFQKASQIHSLSQTVTSSEGLDPAQSSFHVIKEASMPGTLTISKLTTPTTDSILGDCLVGLQCWC